jgi:Tfp pilus assembly protein PilO
MDKLKQWVTLTLVASVFIVAAGWFLAVGPKRSEAAELRRQAEEQLATNSTLETQLQVLRAQAKDLPKEQAKLAAVAAKIPADPALPSLVRALLDASERAGVDLVSVAPGAPELVAAAAPVAVPAPAAGQSAPVAGAPVAPAAPVAGPAGQLANIPVAITVVGDFFEVQQFMSALETLPRALRVSDLTMSPGTAPTDKSETPTDDGRRLSTQISGIAFMAANRPPATAATVPGDVVAADATADAAATTATPAG